MLDATSPHNVKFLSLAKKKASFMGFGCTGGRRCLFHNGPLTVVNRTSESWEVRYCFTTLLSANNMSRYAFNAM